MQMDGPGRVVNMFEQCDGGKLHSEQQFLLRPPSSLGGVKINWLPVLTQVRQGNVSKIKWNFL